MEKTKIAIGCLIQWYESEIVGDYLETLKEAIEFYGGKVLVDIQISSNEDLEKCISREKKKECLDKIIDLVNENLKTGYISYQVVDKLTTIADYRREFNNYYCEKADVLVWGESDMLVPKQMFSVIDRLNQGVSTPKYLATFSICKMWDSSWKPLEHPEFTDKPFIENDTENWWSLRYVMSKDQMNWFNDGVEEINLTLISPHKFNGCGLVISSEVIKSGVNIPKSVFFVHEDTAFMMMTNKILGDIPQYHFRDFLLVHNRKHPEKRSFIVGEENIDKTNTGELRKVHSWYQKANSLSEVNCYNLFNPNFKSKGWEEVFQ